MNGHSRIYTEILQIRSLYVSCIAWTLKEKWLSADYRQFTSGMEPSTMVTEPLETGLLYSTSKHSTLQEWLSRKLRFWNRIQVCGTEILTTYQAKQSICVTSSMSTQPIGSSLWWTAEMETYLLVDKLTQPILQVQCDVKLFLKWTPVKHSEFVEL